ncbi:hypothetical protein D3218_05580 [Aureimonas flava]|uniref:DUF1176 domain-containing protein n=1 Tax=Aureimonas flava TaxID=2320271 RepID=A0A3A1WP79_9HYPH|nr:hypothetical protein D3218_05580 [Aureimonas flava]
MVLVGAAAPAAAQEAPAYRDDRSTPEAVVESLYNAVERREWARAYSYFRDEADRPFAEFAAGYADTRHVRLKLGTATSEGAAGSLYFRLPAVVEAETAAGTRVFAGCYTLRLAQPAAQIEPPFRPMGIAAATLRQVPDGFEAARGRCDEAGTP